MTKAVLLLLTVLLIVSCRATSAHPNVLHGRTWVLTDIEYRWLGEKLADSLDACGAISGRRIYISPVVVRTEGLAFNSTGSVSRLRGRIMEKGAFVAPDAAGAALRITILVDAVTIEQDPALKEYRLVYTVSIRTADPHGKVVHADTFKIDSVVLGQDRPR